MANTANAVRLSRPVVGVETVLDVCGLAGLDCLLKRVKRAYLDALAICANFCAPLVSVLGPVNAVKSRGVCGSKFNVFQVFPARHGSQVFNPIVRSASIDVINVSFGPLSMLKRPYDAVSLKPAGENVAAEVACAIVQAVKRRGSCNPAVEGRAKAFRGKLSFWHKHAFIARQPSHLPRSRVMCDSFPQDTNVYFPHDNLQSSDGVMIAHFPQGGNV